MQRHVKRGMMAMLFGGTMLLSACAKDIRKSGYFPLEQELAAVTVGASTRADVTAALGSPSLQDDGQGALYYVGQRTSYFGPFPPKVIERQVVVVSFDARGKVANVQTLGLEDGVVVVLSQRVTESAAPDVKLFRQIFGNIGRVDAGQLVGN